MLESTSTLLASEQGRLTQAKELKGHQSGAELANKKKDLMAKIAKKPLPDVSHEVKPKVEGRLDQVGMEHIEMPVLVRDSQGDIHRQPAKVSAFVSLDQSKAKGIHMSRLYLSLQQELEKNPIDIGMLKKTLDHFVETQKGLSISSYLEIQFDLPVKRAALKSSETGWRQYPVKIKAQIEQGKFSVALGCEVLYSSTCPCSAALSRHLTAEQFKEEFSQRKTLDVEAVYNWLNKEGSIAATPHAQRSVAQVMVKLDDKVEVVSLIDQIESALQTPVQSAVKREDEQEFARLNAANLMFCEDAARKIKNEMNNDSRYLDFYIKVIHQESLHPHDAVSVVVKGVPGGWTCHRGF